jgi:hypothetical protein
VGGAVWLFIVPCACPLLFRRYCACLKDVAPFGVSSPWSRPVFLFVLDLGAGWGVPCCVCCVASSPVFTDVCGDWLGSAMRPVCRWVS